jgi:AcrR family transcriptional regulator
MNKRPYHHGDLRHALIAAAEKAIKTQGVNDLSLRSLSRELGVSNGAPSRHFKNKQALLDALAIEGFNRLRTVLERAVADREEDFDTRITKLARAHVRFAIKNAALINLMYAAKHANDAPAELVAASNMAFSAGPITLTEGQKSGSVVSGNPRHLSLPIFAAIEGLVAISRNGKIEGINLDVLVTEVIKRIILGLRPR